MPLKQQVKYTIGKESTPGTPVARSAVLPIKDIGSLDRDITKNTDPLIAGLSMDVGEYAVAGDVKGSIPLSPRPCKGWGMVLKGIFGAEATPVEVMGAIRVKYKGTAKSCKIVTDATGKTVKAYVGDPGEETLDATFGTSGTITLSNASTDTMAEVLSVINGNANYEAALVTGDGTRTITSIVSGTYQACKKWAFLWLTGAGSGAYLHQFTPDLTLLSERHTFSIQRDGFQDNYLYSGIVFDKLSLSAALKAELDGSVDVLGFTEASGQTASSLVAPSAKPYRFGGGFTSLAGTKYSFVRKHEVKIDNGHNTNGYGQDSLDRAYHQRGKFSAEGSLSLRLDVTSIAERPKAESGEFVPVQFMYFEVENSFNFSVVGAMVIEFPYAEISETPKVEANGDALDIGIKFKAFNPGTSASYEPPVIISILTADSEAY